VRSADTTTTSGNAYADKCLKAGVPLPPSWGGPKSQWKQNGTGAIADSYVGGSFLNGEDSIFWWESQAPSPAGICVAKAGPIGVNAFDAICQGSNGKACFWEGTSQTGLPAPTTAVTLVSPNTGTTEALQGGTGIGAGDSCTRCHAGQNAFITHDVASNATDLVGEPYWMLPNTMYDPIVQAGYPQNPGPQSLTSYPTSTTGCTTCHWPTGPGGQFPTMLTPQFDGNYCVILLAATNRPALQSGMPPINNTCTSGTTCAAQTDPFAQALLSNCGVRGSWSGPTGGSSAPLVTGVSSNVLFASGNGTISTDQSAAGNGNTWAIDQWNDVYYWDGTSQSWIWTTENDCCTEQGQIVAGGANLPGDNFAWLATGSNNYRIECNLGVDVGGITCGTNGGVVTQIGGNAVHGLVSPNANEAWGIDQNGVLNHSINGAAFVQVSTPQTPKQLAISPFDSNCDTLWAVSTGGVVFRCTKRGSSYTFSDVATLNGVKASSIAVADGPVTQPATANNVWITVPNEVGAYRYNGSGWTQYASGAVFVQIVAGPGSNDPLDFPIPAEVWALDVSGNIYRFFGNSFVTTGRHAINNSALTQRLSVAGHGDNIWAIGTDNGVYNW
jgi:hypothetical protein